MHMCVNMHLQNYQAFLNRDSTIQLDLADYNRASEITKLVLSVCKRPWAHHMKWKHEWDLHEVGQYTCMRTVLKSMLRVWASHATSLYGGDHWMPSWFTTFDLYKEMTVSAWISKVVQQLESILNHKLGRGQKNDVLDRSVLCSCTKNHHSIEASYIVGNGRSRIFSTSSSHVHMHQLYIINTPGKH